MLGALRQHRPRFRANCHFTGPRAVLEQWSAAIATPSMWAAHMGLAGPHDMGTYFIRQVLSEPLRVWLAHAGARGLPHQGPRRAQRHNGVGVARTPNALTSGAAGNMCWWSLESLHIRNTVLCRAAASCRPQSSFSQARFCVTRGAGRSAPPRGHVARPKPSAHVAAAACACVSVPRAGGVGGGMWGAAKRLQVPTLSMFAKPWSLWVNALVLLWLCVPPTSSSPCPRIGGDSPCHD